MTAPPTGVFDRPQGDAYDPEPAAGSTRKPFLIVALALVAALVIGGGAFAFTRALGGGGDQPASALPANTAAYLRMDIDPSVGQKIAAVRFLQGLDPEVMEVLRSDDLRKEAFDRLAEEEPAFADIDYDRDIEPWLGDRMAVGVVPDGTEEPIIAFALQVKDAGAAEEGLERLLTAAEVETDGDQAPLGWFFHDDYVVLAERNHVSALQQGVEAGTLADHATFAGDIDALGDEGILSFWMDGGALAQYADDAAGLAHELDPYGSLGSMGGWMGGDLSSAEGRVAGAVRFGEDFIEVHGVTRGFEAALEDTDTPQVVLSLPEDTAVAAGMEHGDQIVAIVWDELAKVMPEELAEVQREAAEFGYALPQDLQTILGQSLAVAVGPEAADESAWQDPTTAPLAYRVATDVDAANTLIDRIMADAGLGPDADEFLVRSTDDGVLTIGMNDAYVRQVASGGTLADNAVFRSAVPNAEDADTIFYVNLNTFESLYLDEIDDAGVRASVQQIAAIGMSARWAGNEGEFTLRVVAD